MNDLTPTEIEIMQELDAGTLRWGAAVGACWKNLVRHGYVQPHFGPITAKGREFVASLPARKP